MNILYVGLGWAGQQAPCAGSAPLTGVPPALWLRAKGVGLSDEAESCLTKGLWVGMCRPAKDEQGLPESAKTPGAARHQAIFREFDFQRPAIYDLNKSASQPRSPRFHPLPNPQVHSPSTRSRENSRGLLRPWLRS